MKYALLRTAFALALCLTIAVPARAAGASPQPDRWGRLTETEFRATAAAVYLGNSLALTNWHVAVTTRDLIYAGVDLPPILSLTDYQRGVSDEFLADKWICPRDEAAPSSILYHSEVRPAYYVGSENAGNCVPQKNTHATAVLISGEQSPRRVDQLLYANSAYDIAVVRLAAAPTPGSPDAQPSSAVRATGSGEPSPGQGSNSAGGEPSHGEGSNSGSGEPSPGEGSNSGSGEPERDGAALLRIPCINRAPLAAADGLHLVGGQRLHVIDEAPRFREDPNPNAPPALRFGAYTVRAELRRGTLPASPSGMGVRNSENELVGLVWAVERRPEPPRVWITPAAEWLGVLGEVETLGISEFRCGP
jgi:hypothetical protein